MKKHKVEITETLQRTIVVEAETEEEAIEIVEEQYRNEEIVLDYNDHIDTEITIDTHYNYGTNEGEIYYAAELEKVE